MDDFVVGRKAIIEFLRAPLDLSRDPQIAWNKIMRWRKRQGMDGLFHRDITGRPFILKGEVKEWLMNTGRQPARANFTRTTTEEIISEDQDIGQ